jgi:hypothetical protein
MKKIINISGAPGSGKTTLAWGLSNHLSMQSKVVHYAEEAVKDWANRKVPIGPIDQFGIFGNQTLNITSGIKSGADYIVSCTSPALCAFYANYYARTGNYLSLIDATKNFEAACLEEGYMTYNFVLVRSEEDYRHFFKQEGRYENLEQSLGMQEIMRSWFLANFPETIVRSNLDIYSIEREVTE